MPLSSTSLSLQKEGMFLFPFVQVQLYPRGISNQEIVPSSSWQAVSYADFTE